MTNIDRALEELDEEISIGMIHMAQEIMLSMPTRYDQPTLFALPNEMEAWRKMFPGVRILPRLLKLG